MSSNDDVINDLNIWAHKESRQKVRKTYSDHLLRYRQWTVPLKEAASPPGGEGNDPPSLRVPATRILKELPCFGVKFSNIHPGESQQ